MLKVFTRRTISNREKISYFLKQMPKGARATKNLLKILEMSEEAYKEIDPRGVLNSDNEDDDPPKKDARRRPSAGDKLLASSRVKALEETPAVPPRSKAGQATNKPSIEELVTKIMD